MTHIVVPVTNATDTLSVVFDGGEPLPVVTSNGNSLSAGEFVAGTSVIGVVSGGQFIVTTGRGLKGDPGLSASATDYREFGDPDAGLGDDGETYINLENGEISEKQAGNWVVRSSIRGPSGLDGMDGAVEGQVQLSQFGFGVGKTWQENKASWQAALQFALDNNRKQIKFPSSNGEEVHCGQMDLPDFIVEDRSQTPGRQIELIGIDELDPFLKLEEPGARYLIGHPSWRRTSNRAQNSFVKISKMRLQGIEDFDVDAPLIALSNVWGADIKDIVVGGNPGGNAIDIYSFSRGGAQTGNIRRVRGLKRMSWVNGLNGGTIYPRDILRVEGCRYLIGINGAIDSVGKANNWYIDEIEGYTMLHGMVDTMGFGVTSNTDLTSNIFPNGGGSDNIMLDNVFGAFEAPNKMEVNNISQVDTPTRLRLTTTAGDFVDQTTGDFNDCIIKIRNPVDGFLHSRRISQFFGSSRQVRLFKAFPFTIQAGMQYEIAFCDAKAWDEGMHPEVLKHNIRWASAAYGGSLTNSRAEEGTNAVKMSYANHDFILSGNRYWTDRSRGHGIFDTPEDEEFMQTWAPRNYHGPRPRGFDEAASHLITPTIQLGDPADIGSDYGNLIVQINQTSLDLENGDLVRLSSNNQDALLTFHYTSAVGEQLVRPIYNPTELKSANGKPCSVCMDGRVRVKCLLQPGQQVNYGDFLMAGADGFGIVIPAADVELEHYHRRVGIIKQNYSATPAGIETVLLHAWIGV